VFKFQMQSWQRVELHDANSVGRCHPELCAWEDTRKSAFLLAVRLCSVQRKNWANVWWAVTEYHQGKGGSAQRGMLNNILEGCAKHLGLNCHYSMCPPSSPCSVSLLCNCSRFGRKRSAQGKHLSGQSQIPKS
jgi:hypothetical protein